MAIKEETSLQRRVQKRIAARGGYIPHKNHGNMITIKGLHDLPFIYKGYGVFFEVKTEEAYLKGDAVSTEQGIHCRLARKSFALTAIIWNMNQVDLILDHLDYCDKIGFSPKEMQTMMDGFYERNGLDDGTKY